MGYTWAEFQTFLRLARARRARDSAELLVITNRAMAGGDDSTKLLRELNRAAADDTGR